MKTLLKQKRLEQINGICKKQTAQTLKRYVRGRIFPLPEVGTANPFIKRLQSVDFHQEDLQRGFLGELIKLLHHGQVPVGMLYSKMDVLVQWYQDNYYKKASASKPFGKRTFEPLSERIVRFVNAVKNAPVSLAVWEALMLLLRKRDPILVAQLLNKQGINKLKGKAAGGIA